MKLSAYDVNGLYFQNTNQYLVIQNKSSMRNYSIACIYTYFKYKIKQMKLLTYG